MLSHSRTDCFRGDNGIPQLIASYGNLGSRARRHAHARSVRQQGDRRQRMLSLDTLEIVPLHRGTAETPTHDQPMKRRYRHLTFPTLNYRPPTMAIPYSGDAVSAAIRFRRYNRPCTRTTRLPNANSLNGTSASPSRCRLQGRGPYRGYMAPAIRRAHSLET